MSQNKETIKEPTRPSVGLNGLLAAIEADVENCAAKLETIELPSTKGSYYLNQAHNDLKAAMIEINNLRRQLRG